MLQALCWLSLVAGAAEPSPDVRCGSYSLYVALASIGCELPPFDDFEQQLGQPSSAGYSLGELAQAARQYGAETLGVETSAERLALRQRPFACIAHLDGNHFVNLVEVDEAEVMLVDFPKRLTLPRPTLDARWDGTALLVAKSPLVREEDLRAPIGWWRVAAVATGLVLVLAASTIAWSRWRTA